jgi:hypothetical protein
MMGYLLISTEIVKPNVFRMECFHVFTECFLLLSFDNMVYIILYFIYYYEEHDFFFGSDRVGAVF